jgi:hypothetical protein
LLRRLKQLQKSLKKAIGRKLAARVLRKWTEDFVDEDTGELVTLERNEIILERDVILDEENIRLDSKMLNVDTSSFKKKILKKIIPSFTIRYKKIHLLLK